MQGYGSRHLKVFLLDDHDIVRRGLLDLLTKRDITVIGDTGSAVQAARILPSLRPDVMLLDIHLQDGTGVQVCRDVRSVEPSIKGVLLSAADEDEALVLAVLAGASGYVSKLASVSQVVDAVRRLGAGQPVLDASLVQRVKAELEHRGASLQPALTPREQEVVSLVLAGQTDQQVADRLGQPLPEVRADVAGLIARLS